MDFFVGFVLCLFDISGVHGVRFMSTDTYRKKATWHVAGVCRILAGNGWATVCVCVYSVCGDRPTNREWLRYVRHVPLCGLASLEYRFGYAKTKKRKKPYHLVSIQSAYKIGGNPKTLNISHYSAPIHRYRDQKISGDESKHASTAAFESIYTVASGKGGWTNDSH